MQTHHRYWIAFNLVKGIGPARTRSLINHFSDLESAWHAQPRDWVHAGLGRKLASRIVQQRKTLDLDAICDDLNRRRIDVRCWEDDDYPPRLLEIDHPPPLLYLRGSITQEDRWAVAIVGTRKVTAYGRQVSVELAEFLSRNGITVVSGFARGIDTASHQAAVRTGGRTIAVLGCGVDTIYPPENRRLAHQILEEDCGALISDYPLGTPPEGQNFPPRNRIISGLTLATVVIEAGERSGALITANFALEQGREIMAVPGSIFAPTSAGTNRLIRNGAHPYNGPEDVLEVLDWVRVVQYPERSRDVPADGLEKILYEHLRGETAHMDEISAALNYPVDQIAAALTIMEVKGLVRQVDGQKFSAL